MFDRIRDYFLTRNLGKELLDTNLEKEHRQRTADVLQNFAERGWKSIRGALPFMHQAMNDKDPIIRSRVMKALVWHYLHRVDSAALQKLADNPEAADKMVQIVWFISRQTKGWPADIRAAFPALEKVWNLQQEALNHELVIALVNFYIVEKKYEKIFDLLGNAHAEVQASAALALGIAAGRGAEVQPFVPRLAELLFRESGNVHFRREVTDNLARAGVDIRPILEVLRKRKGVYIGAWTDYVWFNFNLDRCKSLEALEGIERMVQNYFVEFWGAQSQAARSLGNALKVKIRTAQVLGKIGNAKAALVKQKDGELLAGETVSVPQKRRGNGIYRMTANRGIIAR